MGHRFFSIAVLCVCFFAGNPATADDAKAAPKKVHFPLLSGSFFSRNGIFKGALTIKYSEPWDEYTITDLRKHAGTNIYTTDPRAPSTIRLVPRKHSSGRTIWVPAEEVFFRHTGNGCRFQYYVEISTTEDGFFLREKYPTDSWGHGGDGCTLHHYEWKEHAHPYRLAEWNYVVAYNAAVDRETNADRKAEWELFVAVSMDKKDDVKALLSKGVSPVAKDWREWTPIQVAVSLDRVEILEMLLDQGNVDRSVLSSAVWQISNESLTQGSEETMRILHLLARSKDETILNEIAMRLAEHASVKNLSEFLVLGIPAAGRSQVVNELVKRMQETSETQFDQTILDQIKAGVPSEWSHGKLLVTVLDLRRDDFFWQLIQAGANPKAKYVTYSERGLLTPVLVAAQRPDLELMKKLIADYGIDPCEKVDNKNALAFAIEAGNLDGVKYLIEKCDIHQGLGPKNAPAIVYAAQMPWSTAHWAKTGEMIEAILKHSPDGGKVTEVDDDGYTVTDRIAEQFRKHTNNYSVNMAATSKKFVYQRNLYTWLVNSYQGVLKKEKTPTNWVMKDAPPPQPVYSQPVYYR